MDNPFKKRRTELISDRRTLLSLVSPTPIEDFFRVEKSELLEKLTMVVGTPGCGKTTIAQVAEFESLATLCRPAGMSINKELTDVLTLSGLIAGGIPTVLGHRLAMATNFRDIWELPYPDPMKSALLRAFLQAKAVLGWFRQLETMNVSLDDVEVVLSANSESVAEVTGANDPRSFRQYAREIELDIFKIVTALVPPSEEELAEQFLNTRYDVFEVLKALRVLRWPDLPEASAADLRPLVVIDDAHELHPHQFLLLRDWLKSKAVGVSRWLMCRPDVVPMEDYREALKRDAVDEDAAPPGSTRGRDYLIKLMQLGSSRERRFKPIAIDIANRYIRSISEFTRRDLKDIRPMLDVASPTLPDGTLKQLDEQLRKIARSAQFSPNLVDSLRSRIPGTARDDEALAALAILLHRERNKTPQLGLLPDDQLIEEPVSEGRVVNASLMDGARIHLMHEFDRPYYYGTDKLIAASNANIEQFIRLAGGLVDELLARLIRGGSADLPAKAQHASLVSQAKQTMRDWDFPYSALVRELVHQIAKRCLERTLLPNAPLDDGANAIGVPQDEMDKVLRKYERLARVLHFAFAYKALVFVPQYHCKNKVWCLLELGAIPCMSYGLTLRRGGFIEEKLSGVQAMLATEGA